MQYKKIFIPLATRGASADSRDNFLASVDNIFVMDNHRLALWCWFQKIQKSERYNLFHIDAHPDLSESGLKEFNHDLWTITLDDYRSAHQKEVNSPLFRWDNYIEIFLQKYPENVGHTISATHHLGSTKDLKEVVKPIDLVRRLDDLFSERIYLNDLPWIVNLDIDYFFSSQPQKLALFSEEYVEAVALSIKRGLDNGMIKVLTIALSPECCGGWEKAEGMLKRFQQTLGMQ